MSEPLKSPCPACAGGMDSSGSCVKCGWSVGLGHSVLLVAETNYDGVDAVFKELAARAEPQPEVSGE